MCCIILQTDEGVLRQTMHNVVVGDGPIDRAILLHDRIEKLRETGQLVPNPDVVERIEQSLGDNSIVRMTEDEFEGKSAEELTKLSQEAAASEDYYRVRMCCYLACTNICVHMQVHCADNFLFSRLHMTTRLSCACVCVIVCVCFNHACACIHPGQHVLVRGQSARRRDRPIGPWRGELLIHLQHDDADE